MGVGCIDCDACTLDLVLAAGGADTSAAAFFWALVLVAGGPWLLGVVAVAVVRRRCLLFLVGCPVVWWLCAATLGTGGFLSLGTGSILVME